MEKSNKINDPSLIDLLISRIFGSRCQVREKQVMKDQRDYLLVIVKLSRPALRVVVKLAGINPLYPCPFDRTAALYRLVAERTEIPMPDVYAVDMSCREWPWKFMIKSYLPGVEWAKLFPNLSEDEKNGAYQALGRAVAQLHSIRYPGYGEIAADGTILTSQPLIPALTRRAATWIRDPVFLDFFLTTLERYSALFQEASQASLTHEDLHKYNLLFARRGSNWRLATILDFDKAWAGPPESDLARLDLWRGMSAPGFWQAYKSIRPISPLFAQRRLAYQLLWCLEYASPSPVHIADTQGVCSALGVQLPKLFT